MQYEKAYAELIVFGGDVIVTSPSEIWDSPLDRPEEEDGSGSRPTHHDSPRHPGGGRRPRWYVKIHL